MSSTDFFFGLLVFGPLFIWLWHYRRLEPSKGRPLRLRSLVVRWSGGPREAVRVLGAGGESWSSIKLSGLPSASPSGRLPQLEPGDMVSMRSSLPKPTTLSWCCSPWGPTSCAPTSSPVSPSVVLLTFLPPSWSSRRLDRKLMYFMARRRISFLLNFLSGGWVGMSLRSSANAPFTFCCRQRSRLLVKMRRTIFGWPAIKDQQTNTQVTWREWGEEAETAPTHVTWNAALKPLILLSTKSTRAKMKANGRKNDTCFEGFNPRVLKLHNCPL